MPSHARPTYEIPQADAAPNYFYIQSVSNGTVLTVEAGSADPGTLTILRPVYSDPSSLAYQLWTLTADRLLVNKGTGTAITERQLALAGDSVHTFPVRTPIDRHQRWRFSPSTGQLVCDAASDLALAAAPFLVLQRRATPATPNQQWRMVKEVLPQPSMFFIEHQRTKGVLSPAGGNLASGTRLAVEPQNVNYQAAQLWAWTGNGALVNTASSLVADVNGNVNTGNIMLFTMKAPDDPNGTANQEWTYTTGGRISSGVPGGGVLAMENDRATSGPVKLVGANDRNTDTNQQWRVRRAVYPEPVTLARAVHLNGASQALSLVSPGPQLGDFTAEAWVRTTTGGPVITSTGTATASSALALVIAGDGSLVLQTTGGSAPVSGYRTASITTGPTAAIDGEWHHLAAVRQGRGLSVYLDGVAVAPARTVDPGGDLGNPPEQRIQFGTIRVGNGVTTTTWLNGDLAEVRLWNRARTEVEIPAGMHHQVDDHATDLLGHWAFAGDDGRDSSLGNRNANLIGNPAFLDSDVDIVPQGDFYLVPQARLIQDYRPAPDGTSAPTEIEGYRVTCTIRDSNDVGTPGFLTLQLNNPSIDKEAVLNFSDGTQLTLNNSTPQITLSTDPAGVATFTMDAEGDLICPTLRVQADFQTDGSWMVIAADRQAHAALAAVSGNNLRGLNNDGTPIPDKTAPLPTNVDGPTADATAAAITQMMSTAVQPNAQADQQQMRPLTDLAPTPTIRPYLPRYQLAGIVATGHDPITDAIATHHVDRDVPIARILTPANAEHPHWGFDFKSFTPHSTAEAAREIGDLASLAPTGDLAKRLLPRLTPGHITGATLNTVTAERFVQATQRDILTTTGAAGTAGVRSWIRDHVRNAERLLVNTVKTVIKDADGIEREVQHLAVTAVDRAGHALYALIEAVDHAVDVVAGILEKLGSDIRKIVTFLKDLFNWQDVLNTQRMIHTYINNLQGFVLDVVASANAEAAGAIRSFKQNVDNRINSWRDSLIAADAQHTTSDTASGAPLNTKSNYVQHMTMGSLHKQSTATSAVSVTASGLDPSILQGPANQLCDQWLLAVGSAWEAFPGQVLHSPLGAVHDVKSFLLDCVEVLLNTIEALADAVANCMIDLVNTLTATITQMITRIYQIGNQELHIPVLTPFYEKIVMRNNGEKLNLLGLASLLVAVPYTFAYKLTHDDKAPYTTAEANAFVALPPSQYTWLVNPFKPRPARTTDVATATAPVVLAASTITMVGEVLGYFGGVISDADWVAASTTSTAFGFSRQLRYAWDAATIKNPVKRAIGTTITAFCVLSDLLGLVANCCSIADPDVLQDTRDRDVAICSVFFSFIVAAGSVVAAWRAKDFSRLDTVIMGSAGVVDLILASLAYDFLPPDKKRETREKVLVAGGVFSSVTTMLQWLKFGVAYAPSNEAKGVFGGILLLGELIGGMVTIILTSSVVDIDRGDDLNPAWAARYLPAQPLFEIS